MFPRINVKTIVLVFSLTSIWMLLLIQSFKKEHKKVKLGVDLDLLPLAKNLPEDLVVHNRLIRRHNHISEICRQEKFKELLDTIGIHPFHYTKKDILFCSAPGAGTSFIMKVISNQKLSKITRLAGSLSYQKQLFISRRKHSLTEQLVKNNFSLIIADHYKFAFVRNPYARILSIYLNILESDWKSLDRQITDLVKAIRAKYGPSNDDPYLHKSEGAAMLRIQNSASRVTFEEFVRFITEEASNSSKAFWRPIQESCLPCMIDYDFVGKIETLEADLKYGLEISGSINANNSVPQDFLEEIKTTNEKLLTFWRSIPSELLKKFVQAHINDFVLFQYDKDLEAYGVNQKV